METVETVINIAFNGIRRGNRFIAREIGKWLTLNIIVNIN